MLSLAAAGYSAWTQIVYVNLIHAAPAAHIAPLPEGVLPPGVAMPPAQPELGKDARTALESALWRDPLDPRLFNLVYADAVRTGLPEAVVQRDADILAKLGWRFVPAQQNLIMRAGLDNDPIALLDRVDALLRRQRLAALCNAVEANPQTQNLVIDRLRSRPMWRHGYLGAIGPQTPPEVLAARVRTLNVLLRSPGGVNREEMAPSLIALAATGNGRDASRLWARLVGGRADSNLVFDPDFHRAAEHASMGDSGIPFEWRVGQDLGYSGQVTTNGVTINWDRRGVPTFLSQLLPVQPGSSYRLAIRGRSDGGALGNLLTPTIICGNMIVELSLVAERLGEAVYRSPPLPKACDMGTLAINGRIDTGAGSVNIDITHVALARTD
jgi:hypothetical protein